MFRFIRAAHSILSAMAVLAQHAMLPVAMLVCVGHQRIDIIHSLASDAAYVGWITGNYYVSEVPNFSLLACSYDRPASG